MAAVREEQGRLVAKHGPGVTGAHLRDMVYAEAVIKVCAFFVLLFALFALFVVLHLKPAQQQA